MATNLCIDCIHCQPDHPMHPARWDDAGWRCNHPNAVRTSLVTGKKVSPECWTIRLGPCGSEGRLFEKKDSSS